MVVFGLLYIQTDESLTLKSVYKRFAFHVKNFIWNNKIS